MPSVASSTAWGNASTRDEHSPGELLSTALPGDLILGQEQRSLVAALEATYSALLADGPPTYNPIVLLGPSGVGKTHLVRSLGESLRHYLGKTQVQYVAASEYAQELVEAIDADDVSAWRDRHRAAHLFILDDLDHLANKELAQDELARTLDFLVAEQRQVILITHQAPARMKGFSSALLARVSSGLSLRMALPGLPAREAILRSIAASKNAHLTDSAFQMLASVLVEAPSALAGAVTYLQAVSAGAEVDAAAAHAYLQQRGGGHRIGVREIAAATARQFGLPLSSLRGNSRRKSIVAARGAAMWLVRKLTGVSLEQIGTYFGGRDHTTVLHACRRTEELAASDRDMRRAVDEIRAMLGASR